jgi:hypothetical protein
LDELGDRLPITDTVEPRISRPFYRIPHHVRSICLALNAANDEHLFDSEVVVFKGTEPLLPDFPRFARWMSQTPYRRAWSASRNIAARIGDHFPIIEGKIPGVVTIREALKEAAIAGEFQCAHVKHYGSLAPIPTPLLVHEFAREDFDRTIACLRVASSAPAFERVQSLAADGFAAYIYHFPKTVFRAGDLALPQAIEMLQSHSSSMPDVEASMISWTRLFVRMLYLGYFPFTQWNFQLGGCFDFGNATIYGGCCDVDSIVAIASSPDDAFFSNSVCLSIEQLRSLFERMLGQTGELPAQITNTVADLAMLRFLEDAVSAEARPSLTLDSRAARFLGPMTFENATTTLIEYAESERREDTPK